MGKDKKYIILAVFWAILHCMEFIVNASSKVSMTAVLIEAGMGKPYFSTGYLTLMLYDLFPVLLFQMLFGMKIYQHFCTASAYYFSRLDNKLKWYSKEVFKRIMGAS